MERPSTPPSQIRNKNQIERSPASITLLTSPFTSLGDGADDHIQAVKRFRLVAKPYLDIELLLDGIEKSVTLDSLVPLAKYILTVDTGDLEADVYDTVFASLSAALKRVSVISYPAWTSLEEVCTTIIADAPTTTAAP